MFAVVHLPHFPLQSALRHESELWSKPVALVDPALHTPVVCGLTDAARAAGVAEGLTPTQAMARCASVRIRHRSPAREAAATEAMLHCAQAFSPRIEATSAGVCTLDLQGLLVLADAEAADLAAWAGRLRTALAGQNLRARVGVGRTPNLARHAARWTDGIEIVGDAGTFVAALPVAALEPSSDVALILEKWGIRTVGELLALGQEALLERIGLEALALFAAASTTATRPLRLVQPAEQFEDSFEFEDAVETMEPLLFILRRFVDQLGARLELAGRAVERMTLRLRLESGEILERLLRIPQPTRQPDVLFRTLHTQLETLRAGSPITGLSLRLDPTRIEQKQLGLFETVLRDPDQFQETLARLSALVGSDRVGTPVLEDSHRTDTFRLVPPDFENAPAVSLDRPATDLRAVAIRRFRPSVKAGVATEAGRKSEHAGNTFARRPNSLRCSVANGKVQVAVGPWRASGHWWEPAVWQCEEWDVATRSGRVLRLVRKPEGWFVEGILD